MPITTGAEPLRAARHARSRSWSGSDECSTASGASKRCAKRATSCGVSAISGHQHQGLFATRDDGLDRAQVHLGLAAAGDAVQQERDESVGLAAAIAWIAVRCSAVGSRPGRRPHVASRQGWLGNSKLVIQPRFSSSRTWSRHRGESVASPAASAPSRVAQEFRDFAQTVRARRQRRQAAGAGRGAERPSLLVSSMESPVRSAAGNAAAITSPGGCR